MIPTPEQADILDERGNHVIIARPGSGKTTTIASVIQGRLANLPRFKGVIAISFTKKASRELASRALTAGQDKRGSFFGTIDNFFLSEIVLPFGPRVLGRSQTEISVMKVGDMAENSRITTSPQKIFEHEEAVEDLIEDLTVLYRRGIIVLESAGILAYHIIRESRACQTYLLARYTDVVIDEYQDCGFWQHKVFLALCELGLRGIAVGDIDQSIFSFAYKDPRFLTELAASGQFRLYPLTYNHRSHSSIVHYTTKFLSEAYSEPPPEVTRIFRKSVEGDEYDTGVWLSNAVPLYAEQFGIRRFNDIAILVRNSRTAELVHECFDLPHKLFKTTPLDDDGSPMASAFKDLVIWLLDPRITRIELLDDALGPQGDPIVRRDCAEKLSDLQSTLQDGFGALVTQLPIFVSLAETFVGRRASTRVIDRLGYVLANEEYLLSYAPAQTNEVQLLTIHKAKGLEFDLIFHLDLHRWILPNEYRESKEDINLHYVALTRAKLACVLCTSTYRHNKDRRLQAQPSPFMMRADLYELQAESPC